jgi:pantothenate synthetase
MKKITTLKKAAAFSKNARKKGKTVGLVVGSFDILHLGHINLFRFC